MKSLFGSGPSWTCGRARHGKQFDQGADLSAGIDIPRYPMPVLFPANAICLLQRGRGPALWRWEACRDCMNATQCGGSQSRMVEGTPGSPRCARCTKICEKSGAAKCWDFSTCCKPSMLSRGCTLDKTGQPISMTIVLLATGRRSVRLRKPFQRLVTAGRAFFFAAHGWAAGKRSLPDHVPTVALPPHPPDATPC